MTDLYQSTCPEFRYEDEKILGTQSHPTVCQPPLIVLQIIIPSKGLLIGYSTHTHTHTQSYPNMHLTHNMASYHIHGIKGKEFK